MIAGSMRHAATETPWSRVFWGDNGMNLKLPALLVGIAVFPGGMAQAHHSFAATYVQEETIQIQGRLIQFQFRNPHSFVHVEAPDENGNLQRWAVEWGGAGQLGSQGVTRATLRPGDELRIIGNPGRDPGDFRLLMRSLRRLSDDFGWGDDPDEVFD
jgi:hypothetical protein